MKRSSCLLTEVVFFIFEFRREAASNLRNNDNNKKIWFEKKKFYSKRMKFTHYVKTDSVNIFLSM